MNPRIIVCLECVFFTVTAILFATPLLAAELSCDQVYASCEQQIKRHQACAVEHDPSWVASAISIREIEQRLESSDLPAVFGSSGPDLRVTAQLEGMLRGIKATAPPALKEPGAVERVLIQDLHRRHAERLESRLAQPRDCEPAPLRRLQRMCRAGRTEAEILTRGDWPAAVGSCG